MKLTHTHKICAVKTKIYKNQTRKSLLQFFFFLTKKLCFQCHDQTKTGGTVSGLNSLWKGIEQKDVFVSELKEYLEPIWRAPSTSRTKDALCLEWVLLRTLLPDLFVATAAASFLCLTPPPDLPPVRRRSVKPYTPLPTCMCVWQVWKHNSDMPFYKAIFPIKPIEILPQSISVVSFVQCFGILWWFMCVSATFAAQNNTHLTTSWSCYWFELSTWSKDSRG